MSPHASTIKIIADAAALHQMNYRLVMSPRRTAPVVRARHAAIRAVHSAKPWLSSPDLGAIFGLDHTSILYALGRLKRKPIGWTILIT